MRYNVKIYTTFCICGPGDLVGVHYLPLLSEYINTDLKLVDGLSSNDLLLLLQLNCNIVESDHSIDTL